jgi:hypothetical protein
MPQSALSKKLKIRPNLRVAVIEMPKGYLKELQPFPEGVEVVQRLVGKFDWIQVFARNQKSLEKLFPKALRILHPEGLIWVSFPKGTSPIQTDLTRDRGWDVVKNSELKWINLISINDTWSAFSLRPFKEGEPRQTFR